MVFILKRKFFWQRKIVRCYFFLLHFLNRVELWGKAINFLFLSIRLYLLKLFITSSTSLLLYGRIQTKSYRFMFQLLNSREERLFDIDEIIWDHFVIFEGLSENPKESLIIPQTKNLKRCSRSPRLN